MKTKSSRAFTLIELLVVISIIAILAAVLVPAVSDALMKGKMTEAQSKGKGIHYSIYAWVHELNSTLAGNWPSATEYPTSTAFFRKLVMTKHTDGGFPQFSVKGMDVCNSFTNDTAFGGNHNAWNLVSNLTEQDGDQTPLLFTKNLDIMKLAEVSSTMQLNPKIQVGNNRCGNKVPFGRAGVVVIGKGGDGRILKPDSDRFNPLDSLNTVLPDGPPVGVPIKNPVVVVINGQSNVVERLSFPSLKVAWVNTINMDMLPVLSQNILMSKYEVINSDFKRFRESHNSEKYKDENLAGDQQPVVQVSWADAKAFCDWLTKKEQSEGIISKAQTYRLPTDKEWEKATDGLKYPYGSLWPPKMDNPDKDKPDTSKPGNYADEAAKPLLGETAIIAGYDDSYAVSSDVGKFNANKHGFCDLGGNVKEWCRDWFDSKQKEHVVRGGSWKTFKPEAAETKARQKQESKSDDVGFRIVLSGG